MINSDTEKNYARCFSTPSGIAVLSHLHQITINRILGPNCSDTELRWQEAQRSLVRHIDTLISRGRGDRNDNP